MTSRALPARSSKLARKAGKKQYVVPYFIASHPGSDLDAMIGLAVFLNGATATNPTRCKTSYPRPFDIANRGLLHGDRRLHGKKFMSHEACGTGRCSGRLMQFFKAENYFMVREALLKAGQETLIGNGCDCLIPGQPPKAAIERRQRANQGC